VPTDADDAAECVLRAAFRNRQGRLIDPQRAYMKGRAEYGERASESSINLDSSRLPRPDQWHDMAYLHTEQARAESLVQHGPALQCLKRIALQADGGWGHIVAPPLVDLAPARCGGWLLPAAVLDGCLVACAVFALKVLGSAQLPRSFGLLRLGRLPLTGEICVLRFYSRTALQDGASFDFTLGGQDGAMILQVEDHRGFLVSQERQPQADTMVTTNT
jgi:hypothetical protein